VVIDERESAETFRAFFTNPGLQAFISPGGASPVQPEMTIAGAVISPDQM
jgi:hypothetical protein